MSLSVEDMQKIMVDRLTDKPQRVKGEEAESFLEEFEEDITMAEENGWTIDIPEELEIDISDAADDEEEVEEEKAPPSKKKPANNSGWQPFADAKLPKKKKKKKK